jgi:hypothetical protein
MGSLEEVRLSEFFLLASLPLRPLTSPHLLSLRSGLRVKKATNVIIRNLKLYKSPAPVDLVQIQVRPPSLRRDRTTERENDGADLIIVFASEVLY